jgi:uncharacterized integral membrane protein
MNYKALTLLILIGLFIVVCIQNVELIPIHFLAWSINISKLLLLLITLIVGILVGIIITGLLKRPKKEEKIDTE